MTREVILQFTAVKQTGTKKVMKTDTVFYSCLRGMKNIFSVSTIFNHRLNSLAISKFNFICSIADAVLKEISDSANLKEKDITDAIGAVINNATDWEGHRQVRKKKN